MMTVRTDHKWKSFKYRGDVPRTVLENDFDWLGEDNIDGFLCYRGTWYHLSEFERGGGIKGYHGFHAHSFSSGVAIEISDDGEEYRIATIY